MNASTSTPASPGSRPRSAVRHHPAAIDRFTLTYLYRELRGRLRQALLIALGLGLGVGLVITVIAASAGVSDAQSTVLHSLYGIGTDLTITKPATLAARRSRRRIPGQCPATDQFRAVSLHYGHIGLPSRSRCLGLRRPATVAAHAGTRPPANHSGRGRRPGAP